MKNDSYKAYQSSYSDGGFWRKVLSCVRKATNQLLESALTLYYVMQDADTPLWAKSAIISALGYFISPIDLCPDVIPVFGFCDDLSVILLAMAAVKLYVKEEHIRLAKKKVHALT